MPTPVDLGLFAIVLVGAVYVAADLAGGAAMVILLLGLRLLARITHDKESVGLDVVVAVALFVGAFVFQTRVGHGVFERGIDDTAMNLAELRRTGNPIPLVLVFYYHALELLFAFGYRPRLARTMETYRGRELARIPNDPRGR